MRTFIAIEISEEMRSALAQAEAHLKYAGADVKWVEPKNIHLTLKFLGEIDESKVGLVTAILDEIAGRTKSFDMTIKDIGAFPKIDFPRVVWVGLDKGALESTALAKEIDKRLVGIGFQEETRPFAAHLTIGRVRTPKNKEKLKDKMLDYKLQEVPPYKVASVILFQSTLTPTGSIYSKLHEARFGA